VEFLDGLYCKKVHYLQNIENQLPIHGMGDMETYRLLRNFRTVSTVMLITVPKEKVTTDQILRGEVIPLLEAIDQRPKSLENAMLSWVQFPKEEQPSGVFIHNGAIDDIFRNWVYTLLVSEIPLAKLGVGNSFEEARKKAEEAEQSTPLDVEELLKASRGSQKNE
jgi:hypothetical protein